MYVLTKTVAQAAFSSDKQYKQRAEDVVSIMQQIAWHSKTQDNLTSNLDLLRDAARAAGKECVDLFDSCFELAKQEIKPEDMDNLKLRYSYEYSDFVDSVVPYKEVFDQESPFERQLALERLSKNAKACGVTNFKKLYKSYESGMRLKNASTLTLTNPSDFPMQPLELECGKWHCDCTGVIEILRDREECACLHPIMPTERFVNIDTGEQKLRVAFYKGGHWRDFIASKRDLYDSTKIIQFAALGVSVTSKSAKLLSEYLCDIEALNQELIPESVSFNRLGYVGDGTQFAPYVDKIIFDGDNNYHNIYKAISSEGSYDTWLSEATKCRSDSLTAQIMLAAAFASPLLNKIGSLPFFVHLWGVESGTGKTVALMLAASVWGNPDVGQYIQTFNSTQVSCERTAAFLNNVPLCIDELQLSKDSHGRSKFDVYQLAQGVGRGRGNRSGGIDAVPTWSLCILTTGESPIVQASAGAGAVNRVIDIECKASDSVIKDGFATSTVIKQNYGFAGRKFIEALTDEAIEQARVRYKQLFKQLSEGDSTEKQAMAAAMIVLADELADKYVYKNGKVLTVEQISGFLKAKSEISAGQRAYNYLCDWVTVNAVRFQVSDNNGEFWGKIDDRIDTVYIISTVFRKALTDNGFDDKAILSWLRSNDLITLGKDGKSTQYRSIDSHQARYVALKLPPLEETTYSTEVLL